MGTAEKRDAPSTDRGLRAAAPYRLVSTDMMGGVINAISGGDLDRALTV